MTEREAVALGLLAVVCAVSVLFLLGWGVWWLVRPWWYSWRRAAHVIEQTRTEPVPAPEFRGSMIRDEELALHYEDWNEPLLAELHHPGQRPRGMTEPGDLGPGAGTIAPVTTATCPADGIAVKVDSPAPDGTSEGALTAPQCAEPWPGDAGASAGRGLSATVETAPARALDLGPDTSRLAWLDQQLTSHADWARRMRGQVTGWGLEATA